MQYSYEKFLKDVGVRIKEMRNARGWTLRDMVVKHNFHLTHWQIFESGKRGIAVPSLLRVAEVFDIRLAELLGEAGELPATRSPRVEAKEPKPPTPKSRRSSPAADSKSNREPKAQRLKADRPTAEGSPLPISEPAKTPARSTKRPRARI